MSFLLNTASNSLKTNVTKQSQFSILLNKSYSIKSKIIIPNYVKTKLNPIKIEKNLKVFPF